MAVWVTVTVVAEKRIEYKGGEQLCIITIRHEARLLYSNLFSATTATTVTVTQTATPNLIMIYAQVCGEIKAPAEQKGVREL